MICSEPIRQLPENDWEYLQLYRNVKEALFSIPTYFHTDTVIEGISATDIFTLNSALGATIESQVVATLNRMRPVWDPEDQYSLYGFVRQSQTFPDVLLRKSSTVEADGADIIMGVELKGWYLLAKEREPSFRFQVTPSVCSVQDLIVIVPWVLSNVISGTPRIFTPYVESARYAAEYRNYHWSTLRSTKSSRKIISPKGVSPYPLKSDPIADKPEKDAGGNFGRFSRTGIMDHYLARILQEELCGICAEQWLDFFKIFQEKSRDDDIRESIFRLRRKVETKTGRKPGDPKADAIMNILDALESLLES